MSKTRVLIPWKPIPRQRRNGERAWERAVASSAMSPGRLAAYREWLRWMGFL